MPDTVAAVDLISVLHAVVLFVAAAFIYCIRRRRSSRREVDVSNHYGSYQTSPQGRLWLKHKLLHGANNSRKALLNADSSTEHRSKRSTVQLFSKGSGGSGSAESALGKPGLKDASGMTSTYNGSRESHTKTTPGGSTCPLSSPGWAESRTSGGGVFSILPTFQKNDATLQRGLKGLGASHVQVLARL